MGNNYFSESRELLKNNGLKTVVATSSLVTLYLTFGHIINIAFPWLPDFITSGSIALVFASASLVYNQISQAHGKDISNALYRDWLKLPFIFHLLLLTGCVLIVYVVDFLVNIIKEKSDNIRTINMGSIAYEQKVD